MRASALKTRVDKIQVEQIRKHPTTLEIIDGNKVYTVLHPTPGGYHRIIVPLKNPNN